LKKLQKKRKMEVKLKVMEALQEEAYKGIVRIDSQTMRQIDVKPGGIVEIEGGRITVGIVDRAYPTDIGQAIIRMDGILRRNAKTGIGEVVKVRKCNVKEAKGVVIAPAQKGVMVQADPDVFRRGLLGRAVVKGDIVALGGARSRRRTMAGSPFEDIFDIFEQQGFMGNFGFGGLKFIVVDANPKQAVIITETTEIRINPKAVEVTEELAPDVTYEDIGGLSDEIKKIREMVELPLKHPEIFERLGVEAPKGVLLHGPTGTGKTLLAKAVANESDSNFLLINGPEVTCLTGDTEVLTNPNGRVKVQELFSETEKSGEIARKDELKEIVIPKQKIKLFSLNENLKIVPDEIEAITKSYAPEIYEIKTKKKGIHKTSRNHPFATLSEEGKIIWKTAKELKRKDKIVVAPKLNLINKNSYSEKDLAQIKLEEDEIENIEKKEGQTVYDISMKNYHNFFAGSPLTLLSNSKFYGESEKRIREIFEEAEKNAPSIIFIDEVDAIAPKREETYGEVERRMVAQLLATMDGLKSRGKVVVIAATNRPNSLDPALRRPGRFDREIEIGVPDKHGRLNILKIHTRNMPLTKDVDLEKLAAITHGFVGADVAALCKEAAMNVIRKILPDLNIKENEPLSPEILEKLRVTNKDFNEALRLVRPSAMREVLIEAPNIKWKDIGGLEELKQELKEAVEWPLKYPGSFTKLGIKPPKGILMYGPPGSGKTLLAKAVANESEANFILIKGPELISHWVGDSLPYGERIIVKKDGKIRFMKIGDIVESKENVQALAFDKEKRIRFTNIRDYIKHPLRGKLLEVTTRTGRKIKVTDYHSLFSFLNGKFTDVPVSHLIPNESYIAIPRNLNLPRETLNSINLYEYFKEDKDVFVSNVKDYLKRAKLILGLGKTADILKVSKKYLADIIYKNLPVSITGFDKLIKEARLALNFEEIKIKLKGSIYEYNSIFGINKDFWRLVGLWMAEGDLNGYTIRLHNQNKEIREDMHKICKDLGFKITLNEKSFAICSLFLQKVFKNVLDLETGAENKKIPEILFTLDKESKTNFLKGYFSGDGSNYPAERGKFQIEAGTVSDELANGLLYLLLDFGIVATIYKKKERTGSITKKISILGVKNFEKFKDIGFIDKKRNDRIGQYIKSRKWFRSDLIPLTGELYNLVTENCSNYTSITKNVGKEKLKEILVYVDKDKNLYKDYWNLVEGDIFFDLVKDIKELPNEDYVYDISVPGEENFVAGFGGVFAHNSEKGIRKVFERARQAAPTIIFFDEIDAIAGTRGGDFGNKVTERMVNQLLTEMDGLEELTDIVVIGSTNRPDMIDPALLRPGRFDRIISTGVPDKQTRVEIFKIHTKNMPLAKDVDLEKLVEQTSGFVGADVEGLCREAGLLALRENMKCEEVKMKHFNEALKKIKPSISSEQMKKYQEIEETYLRRAKVGMEKPPSYLG